MLKKIIKMLLPQSMFEAGSRLLDRIYSRYYSYKFNFKNPLIIRRDTTDRLVFRQIFINRQYDIPCKISPRLIIDGGANVGYASLWFAHRYPQATIFAIEPEEENFKILSKNTKGYSKIKIMRRGLWYRNAFLKIKDHGYGAWGFVTEEADPSKDYDVETITIDEILKQSGYAKVDILKLDIEGAEKELFSQNYASWLDKINILTIELHDSTKEGCSKVFYSAVNKYNFQIMQKGEDIILIKDTIGI